MVESLSFCPHLPPIAGYPRVQEVLGSRFPPLPRQRQGFSQFQGCDWSLLLFLRPADGIHGGVLFNNGSFDREGPTASVRFPAMNKVLGPRLLLCAIARTWRILLRPAGTFRLSAIATRRLPFLSGISQHGFAFWLPFWPPCSRFA